jgi:hypothetical protein
MLNRYGEDLIAPIINENLDKFRFLLKDDVYFLSSTFLTFNDIYKKKKVKILTECISKFYNVGESFETNKK